MMMMCSRFGTVLLAVSALCIARLVAAQPPPSQRLSTRATPADLAKIKGGLLVINGKQTSCELAVLDSQTSMISAACLLFKSGQVDLSANYEVYIDNGYDGATAHYPVQNITVHPSYDPSTLANNVAVLQYNAGTKIAWYDYTAIDSRDWSDIVYSRRSLKDLTTQTWNTPTLVSNPFSDSTCTQASSVYAFNAKDFLCSNMTIQYASDSTCQTPYGVAYAMLGTYVYQIGFYSHTAVYNGSDLCKFGSQRSYFILLSDYLAFLQAVVKHADYYYTYDNITDPQQNASYAMKNPPSAKPSDVTYLSGDFYARQGGVPQAQPSSSSSPSTQTSGPAQTPTHTSSSDNSSSSSSSGLSKRDTIILGVCISVGTIILMVGLFFLIKWWKKKNRERDWDPEEEAANLKMIANEIGGASQPTHHSDQFVNEILEVRPDDGLPTYTTAVAQQPAPAQQLGTEVRQDIGQLLSSVLGGIDYPTPTTTSYASKTYAKTQATSALSAAPKATSTATLAATTTDDVFAYLSQLGDVAASVLPGLLSTPGLSTLTNSSDSSGLPTSTKVALGVAIPAGVLLIAVIVFLAIKLRRRHYEESIVYDTCLIEQQNTVNMIGGAGEVTELAPPVYSELPENRHIQQQNFFPDVIIRVVAGLVELKHSIFTHFVISQPHIDVSSTDITNTTVTTSNDNTWVQLQHARWRVTPKQCRRAI
ncbi:hypothetical protein GQ54DRAFT_333072 [Martensiomyces pterosporus]|nr:hypothetical protein GQ54DRAFT_333072 [Martensiomyces pterosporus]